METEHPTRDWTGRHVLVTGAGGFIGSHLAGSLAAAGARVRAFVRYTSHGSPGWLTDLGKDVLGEIEIFPGDLVNPEAVAGAVAGCDTILHLGALIPIPYSYRHPREYVDANVAGTLNVLEAARRIGIRRLVQVSSSEVYGTPQAVPITEEHPLRPQSPYAATKVGADQLALSYAHSFDVPVVVARPFNTYGPRQTARAVIPTIVSQALTRDRVELGATETTRDFLYVGDTVAGLVRCAALGDETAVGEVFNLGTGRETSIGAVVDLVLERLGRRVPVSVADERLRPPASEVDRLCASWDKAKERLGWAPQVSLEDGIARTVDWIAARVHLYDPTVYRT